jgi:hypothetical protein
MLLSSSHLLSPISYLIFDSLDLIWDKMFLISFGCCMLIMLELSKLVQYEHIASLNYELLSSLILHLKEYILIYLLAPHPRAVRYFHCCCYLFSRAANVGESAITS